MQAPSQTELIQQYGPRDSMEYDVVIVGGGPGGLATAIHIKQLAQKAGSEISVVVLEKGSEIGAHTLSGAVMDPQALAELFPDWQAMGAPLLTPVTEDRLLFLSQSSGITTPTWLLPESFKNHGNYIISLSDLTKWLGTQAESLGVEIFPGFAAAEILYSETGAVRGVATGNVGIDKEHQVTDQFALGMELHAKYTIFAEGARGHLGKQLIAKYHLDADSDPQSYAIGIKELWEIDPHMHEEGLVMHTAGWPLSNDTYGGSFMYHMGKNLVTVIGFHDLFRLVVQRMIADKHRVPTLLKVRDL